MGHRFSFAPRGNFREVVPVVGRFDQWRGDWLEKPELQLPTLKRLARRGLERTTLCDSIATVCTSQSELANRPLAKFLGVTRNDEFTLCGSSPSFVRELQQKGWYTALIGKSHWHPHTAGVDLRNQLKLMQQLGFDETEEIGGPRALAEIQCALTDEWESYEPGLQMRYRDDLAERYQAGRAWKVRASILPNHLYPDIWVCNKACNWLQRRRQSEQPWLLWVSFPGPHEPWDTPSPWSGIHNKRRLPKPAPRPDWIAKQPLSSEHRQRQLQWSNGPSEEDIIELRADYADHLALLDHQLERLIEHLAEPERTAITIVSDHGELLGDAGFLYKSCFLEGAIHSLAIHHRPSFWGRMRRWEKPIGLSWFLNEAAKDVCGENKLHKSKLPQYTFSEFGDELLVCNRNLKLVMKRDGEVLWATDLREDPEEQTNLIQRYSKLPNRFQKLRNEGLKQVKATESN